ncbi:18409_t:CDS:2, partial [Racocetra persica]
PESVEKHFSHPCYRSYHITSPGSVRNQSGFRVVISGRFAGLTRECSTQWTYEKLCDLVLGSENFIIIAESRKVELSTGFG